MDVIRPVSNRKKIRPALVFFCIPIWFFGCGNATEVTGITVNYNQGRAEGVSFTTPNAVSGFQIFLQGTIENEVLGNYHQEGNTVFFYPLIPFSQGEQYQIYNKGSLAGDFTIKVSAVGNTPELLAIYPSKDTVPENLLKMYFQFSEPMQEVGKALDFISVFDETVQREVEVFLELETELWNAEHDRLTLWLDPGRIKTDLIPNREKGLPILKGHRYRLEVSRNWKSAKGLPLLKDYQKTFYVTDRDESKPNIQNWELQLPKAGTTEALKLSFGEALDAVLLQETLGFYDENEAFIAGKLELSAMEEFVEFKPLSNWKKGNYKIISEWKLEDLAGNNLRRLFDTDTQNKTQTKNNEVKLKRSFSIQ